MKLYCPTCSQRLGSADELCRHSSPTCVVCCDDEHPSDHHDDEYGDVA